MPPLTSISTDVSNLSIGENGIVLMEFPKKNTVIGLEDSWRIYEERIKLTPPGTKQLILVDLLSNPKPNREARDFAKTPEMVNSTKAMALIVGGPLSRMLGNFFMGFNKGAFPTKLFTETVAAENWLLGHK